MSNLSKRPVITGSSSFRHAAARRAQDRGVQLKLGVIIVLLGLVIASSVWAGTYVIYACPMAQSGNYSVGPWTQFGSVPGGGSASSFKQTCVTAGDFFGISPGALSSNGTAGEELQAPTGITMSHVKLWWAAAKPSPGGGWSFALIDVYSPSWSRIYQAETPVVADGANGTAPTELLLPPNTSRLKVEIYCTTTQTCDYNQNPMEIFGSEVTVAYNGLPAGSVTGGGLAGSGLLSGTQSLAYDAKDTGAGVRFVELLLDGQLVTKTDYMSECPYQNFAACPTSLSDTISWDTSRASNGTHEVALRIVNAAGNASIIDDHTVNIDNQPVHTSNGSLMGTNGGPPPVAHIANGTPCAGEELGLQVNGQPGVPVIPYGKKVTVRGVLHCGTVPVSNAQVAISTVGGSAGAAISSAIKTGLDGSFLYTVPAGPDRVLRFSYTAYSDEPGPDVTAAATIAIRPIIKLQIGPHHTRNWHVIHWAGTIAGGPYPAQGVTLDAEVKEGSKWRLFEQVVANRKGQFHYSYRFHATTEPTTYRFRVVLPASGSGGYPYTPGASNSVSVYVNQ
jgi:hypothetical protein